MDVQEAVSKVLESEQNANYIVDLIEWTKLPDKVTAGEAIKGLCEVFCNWLEHHYERFTIQTINIGEDDSITVKFNKWVKDKYSIVKKCLVELLTDKELQITAFNGLINLIKWEGLSHQLSLPGKPYLFPNSTLSQLTHCLLTRGDDGILSELIETCLQYEDAKYYLLQNTNAELCDHHSRQIYSVELINKVYKILKSVTPTINDSSNDCAFLCGDPTNCGEEETTEHNVCSLQKHKKVFSDCWLSFLRIPLPTVLHEKVLVSLHSTVMPHMIKPHLLVDFLIGSYDQGGVNSILALNGLFILMHQYHLEYPNFYSNLYSLLDPTVLHVCYMPRFFRLLNIFLSSTHLPLYLVASFVKRISRLCLTAPPQGVMVGCVTIINLIKRHPNCRVLLHRSDPEVLQVSSDPYNMEEEDPAESRALESCLWELQTLQNHYHPEVSSLMVQLLDPESGNNKVQHSTERYLKLTATELFRSECNSQEDEAPVNYSEPDGLWGSGFRTN